jgi:hypothetical protein
MARLLLFIFTITHPIFAVNNYSLKDLEVLVIEGSYREFFDHALDIRPSQRDENWKNMVSKMGTSWARKLIENNKIERNDFVKIETLLAWPGLKNDDVFMSVRSQLGLKYLRQCMSQNQGCTEDLKLFWENYKYDPEIAYQLAEMTINHQNSSYSAWSFLEIALKSPLSEFYCKKKFVMDTLWKKVETDYIKQGTDIDLMKKVDEIIHPDCLPILISEAKLRLYRPYNVLDRELSFQILKSQNKASLEITDFFYTVYLLENPSRGELFNYSWNRIRELGGTAQRRDRVLNQLKSLDPLPDLILSSLDETKKRVVLHHFKKYFPEYLDFYTDQCLSFYGGKVKFHSGNPTMNCQQFMNSSVAPLVIDEFKIKKYFEIKKI